MTSPYDEGNSSRINLRTEFDTADVSSSDQQRRRSELERWKVKRQKDKRAKQHSPAQTGFSGRGNVLAHKSKRRVSSEREESGVAKPSPTILKSKQFVNVKSPVATYIRSSGTAKKPLKEEEKRTSTDGIDGTDQCRHEEVDENVKPSASVSAPPSLLQMSQIKFHPRTLRPSHSFKLNSLQISSSDDKPKSDRPPPQDRPDDGTSTHAPITPVEEDRSRPESDDDESVSKTASSSSSFSNEVTDETTPMPVQTPFSVRFSNLPNATPSFLLDTETPISLLPTPNLDLNSIPLKTCTPATNNEPNLNQKPTNNTQPNKQTTTRELTQTLQTTLSHLQHHLTTTSLSRKTTLDTLQNDARQLCQNADSTSRILRHSFRELTETSDVMLNVIRRYEERNGVLEEENRFLRSMMQRMYVDYRRIRDSSDVEDTLLFDDDDIVDENRETNVISTEKEENEQTNEITIHDELQQQQTHAKPIPAPQIKTNKSSQQVSQNQTTTMIKPNSQQPEITLSTLYETKSYPPLPQSLGTEFVTELSDLMEIDVGHHGYIAGLLDKSWEERPEESL